MPAAVSGMTTAGVRFSNARPPSACGACEPRDAAPLRADARQRRAPAERRRARCRRAPGTRAVPRQERAARYRESESLWNDKCLSNSAQLDRPSVGRTSRHGFGTRRRRLVGGVAQAVRVVTRHLTEDDRSPTAEQHAVLAVPSDCSRQRLALVIPTERNQLVRIHRVVDTSHLLLDDRALIEMGRHVVRCSANQFHAMSMSLEVG